MRRKVIIRAEGLGTLESTNSAIYDLFSDNKITCASLMVNSPWIRNAVELYRGEDVGLSLCLISPDKTFRWGPISNAPTLVDGEGCFPKTVEELFEHADIEEVNKEFRMQIERAIIWGFGLSHLSLCPETMILRADIFDIFISLAKEYRLAISMGFPLLHNMVNYPALELAKKQNLIVVKDSIKLSEGLDEIKALIERASDVAEIVVTPGRQSDELKSGLLDYDRRLKEYDFLSKQSGLLDLVRDTEAELISYRDLLSESSDSAIYELR